MDDQKSKLLLVVECTTSFNWYEVFAGATVNGYKIKVEQAEWDDLSIISYDSAAPGTVQVTIRRATRPLKGTSQETERNVQVDFVLLRSVTRHLKGQDSRNKLFALLHNNVPAVNSLESAYFCLERCLVYGQLRNIRARLGAKNFPLIEQTFYGHFRQMLITPEYPIVGKIGYAHAGYGKMKLNNDEAFQDFKSICALHGDYVTLESFVEWDWDGRIQKIGNHYRVFKRVTPCWKGNTGNMGLIETIELTDQFKMWIDEASKVFGGLEICALDFVHSKKK